ncbi:SLC13 family permease [Arenimonas sp.]|jgi:sodium-dependent dicarboxylate transporter 2/3/5|uniref:SLC13 family permease n=1 Tax=Arenimonas sp. TaxID=1872635 RepID=UPI0037C1623B
MTPITRFFRWFGPLAALFAYGLATASEMPFAFAATLALTVLCAVWWMSEAVDPAFTALLALAVLPMAGILDAKQVAQSVGNELILLLMGGFMLSRALEASGAHRRLAYAMVNAVGGGSGRSLIIGFTFATAFISMWISNTATTLIMLPVAYAIIEHYKDPRLAMPLVLCIAYAASIGGLGTPIGSPPNLVFMQQYQQATGTAYSFLDWMQVGIPVMLLLLPILAFGLSRHLRNSPAATLPTLGAWTRAEKRVLWVFGLTALAWITRAAPFGGWSEWLNLPGANDASVALLAVAVMALVPSGNPEKQPLLTWQAASRIPWGVLLLFAGGIALATAFQESGISDAISNSLVSAHHLPLFAMMVIIIASVVLLSEIASNTATAVLLMPILAAAAKGLNIEPALLMLPAAMAASIGFMLPVATAPNAVAYGSGFIRSKDMLREGFWLDIVSVLVVCAVCWAVLI